MHLPALLCIIAAPLLFLSGTPYLPKVVQFYLPLFFCLLCCQCQTKALIANFTGAALLFLDSAKELQELCRLSLSITQTGRSAQGYWPGQGIFQPAGSHQLPGILQGLYVGHGCKLLSPRMRRPDRHASPVLGKPRPDRDSSQGMARGFRRGSSGIAQCARWPDTGDGNHIFSGCT